MDVSGNDRSSVGALPMGALGQTDMTITRLGIGSWAIGGSEWANGWGQQDDSDSIAAIRHALDLGINWIDTAPAYGRGHSEEVVRRALAEIPLGRRPLVFTKCGLVGDSTDIMAQPKQIAAPASLRRELEGSLKRLGVERIDLYQVHWPPQDGTPLEVYWETLVAMRAEGKVRAIGLSNHSAEQLQAAEKVGRVDTLQPPFSAIRRDIAASHLPWCRDHGTGVIVYSPMQAGLLSGGFTLERARALPSEDWRSKNRFFTGEALVRNMALADGLKELAASLSVTPAELAIAWVLAWPGVSGAIVGGRTPAQVDGWIRAATLQLSPDTMLRIAELIAATGAGSGPSLPDQFQPTDGSANR